MRELRSPDNPRFKRALKLRDSTRERRNARASLLDGVHLVEAYVTHGGMPREVFVSRAALGDAQIAALLARIGTEPLVMSDALLQKLSPVKTPTGVVAVIDTPRPNAPSAKGACVMLDSIQDPGNVGSILRSAAAAAVREVYLSAGCADAWSPRVLRAGMAAHFALHIYEEVDLLEIAHAFKGCILVAAGGASQSIYDTDLTGDVALVFGNEGAGVDQSLRDIAHATISIPMAAGVESMNVAAAAAVCLFERVRQQVQK